MTLAEFMAWLEGFEHSIEYSPTVEQWKAIKEKLSRVSLLGNLRVDDKYLPSLYPGKIKTVPLSHITIGTPLPRADTVIC